MPKDADLDLLKLEADQATTPTRRAWAQRLVDRIVQQESAARLLTESMTWGKSNDRYEPATDTDADRRPSEPSSNDSRGASDSPGN